MHAHCVVCGADHPGGLGLRFEPAPDGSGVRAVVPCEARFQGYDGLLHGGVVSAVLDGAMAHCLFHLGRVGHTGSLEVRFRRPVLVGRRADVRARLELSRGRVHLLRAELEQDGEIKVRARAKFLES